MISIDTRGKLCPLPLIIFKREIKNARPGEEVELLVDNELSCQNLMDHLSNEGISFREEKVGAETKLYFLAPKVKAEKPLGEHASQEGYVIVLNSDQLGHGDRALGEILMRSFINTLDQLERLPRTIVCYNAGVQLLKEGRDTAESLYRLREERGVDVVACGTCVEYYDLKKGLKVGRIVNMLQILELLEQAPKVIYP